MHGLINRSIQCFIRDTYGHGSWDEIVALSDTGILNFEAMVMYDDAVTDGIVSSACEVLGKTRDTLMEDLGTYLASHPDRIALRRLLRFGGQTFDDFLHTLDDLPDWARLAVPDLVLPELELRETEPGGFDLICRGASAGMCQVIVGGLRAMADDYGALVLLDAGAFGSATERITIKVLDQGFSEGRRFDLARTA